MSKETLAAFRKNAGDELAKLAEDHLQHDLREPDRQALESAVSKLSMYTQAGTFIGMGLGLAAAFRVRGARTQAFKAFRAAEKPTHLMFPGGRTEPIPDIISNINLAPTTLGTVATYFFFGTFGVLFGGELGLLAGGVGAKNSINKDPESRKRIESAFRRFRADVLRREIKQLESQETSTLGLW